MGTLITDFPAIPFFSDKQFFMTLLALDIPNQLHLTGTNLDQAFVFNHPKLWSHLEFHPKLQIFAINTLIQD